MLYQFRILLIFTVLFFVSFSASAQSIPTGVPLDLYSILDIGKSLGGFLYVLGGILAVITIISSGIMYFFAGSNSQKIATAKGIFKAGIIGALILFSSGVIIFTVEGFATNPLRFFGGGGGGSGSGGPVCRGGIRAFQPCVSNFACPNEPAGTCGGASQPLCSYSLCN